MQHGYVDQSPLVARRLGFASLPLAVLAILIGSQLFGLVVAIISDGRANYSWTTSAADWDADEVIRVTKWVALGALFWAW
jgi:hypothetical protein